MEQDLLGRVACISGSSRGVSAAIALKLANRGADIVISASESCEITGIAALIRATGRQCYGIVTKHADWPVFFSRLYEAEEILGNIDILIHVPSARAPVALIEDAHMRQWVQSITENITGLLYGAHALIPSMIEHGWGRIIVVSQTTATLPRPALSAQSVSHVALQQMMQILSIEVPPDAIAAIVVDGDAEIHAGEDIAELQASALASGEQIAEIVANMCGDAGWHFHGKIVHVASPDEK